MSASDTDRATATINIVGNGEPPLELEYRFPMTDVENSARTTEHKPIGARTVVQHMGAEAEKLTMRGHCYRDERDFLRTLTDHSKIEITSEEFTGYAVVTRCKIDHTKNKGGVRPENTHTNKNYNYTLSLTETSAPPPDDSQ